jgi:hypothetical protein
VEICQVDIKGNEGKVEGKLTMQCQNENHSPGTSAERIPSMDAKREPRFGYPEWEEQKQR